MKHLLLILISFLLLSSPVIGDNHKGETLYRWDNPDEVRCCDYIWMGFGDKETHPVYQGQVKDGKPNGLGFLIIHFGKSKYVGSWKDGKENGQGIMFFLDGGGKWIGEWKDGRFWNGIDYDKDRKIRNKRVNGEWIKP